MEQQSSTRELYLKKKNQACAGVESRNIISINVVTIISERTLRKKKKRFVWELMYDTHLLTVVQASKWQCLKTFLGKAQNVMVTQQDVHT